MRSLIVLILPLLLLTGCGSKPSFEGKWTTEITAPNGKKFRIEEDFKADGTFVSSRTDPSGKADKRAGKWKKTGDNTCEMMLDLLPNEDDDVGVKPDIAKLLDAKTLEIGDADSKDKVKFTRQ